jgi:hypothetical protein
MTNITRIREGDTTELHVNGVESWDDFESLAKYLQNAFNATIIEQVDGVCTRTWRFRISGEEITLKHHDELGNYFICNVPESELVSQIMCDLDRRLDSP